MPSLGSLPFEGTSGDSGHQRTPRVAFEVGGNSTFHLDDSETNHFDSLTRTLSLRSFNGSMRNIWKGALGEGEDDDDGRESESPKQAAPSSHKFEKLQFTESDMQSLVEDRRAFQTLQMSLKQRKCTTNMYLQQTVHHYVKHVKDVRQQHAKKGLKTAAPTS